VRIDGFTPEQREVIEAGEGPLSILAGPGAGKTTALAGRIAYLVDERSVPAHSVLAITFTTAAAATLRKRLSAVLGERASQVDILTFHALGLRIIRQWREALGFGDYPPAVYARDDARALLREAATSLGLDVASDADRESDPWKLSVAKLASAVERFRLHTAEGAEPWDGCEGIDEELVRSITEAYEALLRDRAAVDYASMLVLPKQLLESDARAARLLQDAYRFVMVDEFQDTCRTQNALLRKLVDRHRNLMVVGDPQQCVFSWRSADPRMLLEFRASYPEARVIVLNQNHRSTGVIVSLSNTVARPLNYRPDSWTDNPPGPPARVYAASDETDEARFVAQEIERLLASGDLQNAGQVAVLFRTNAQARMVALALRARSIAFRARPSLDLFGRAEVRDAIAYLRLAHNPTDGPALARVINTPPRRLRAIEQALRKRPVPARELADWALKRGGPPARDATHQFQSLLAELHGATQSCPPSSALDIVLGRTGYAEWLRAQEHAKERLMNLEQLRVLARESEAADIATWLADLHLGEGDVPSGSGESAVSLTTIHTAKGQEWPAVFVIGMEEGLLPHSNPTEAEDEERRLTYVAFSRPQVLLYLTYCRTRRPIVDGRPGAAALRRPSRFLHPLPPDLLQRVA
jgi:DNA helicase-2/ATP-dependent DNA helicase PcrA